MALRRPSDRETRLAIKGQLDGLAVLAGKEPTPYLSHISKERKPRKPRVTAEQSEHPSQQRLEKHVVNDIREWQRQRTDVTLWRNTSGMVELAGGGRLRYGVGPNGASDFIGYRTLIVTADMIGKRLAQFLAVECKAARGEPTDDQITFIDRVKAAGGRAGIARSAEDAEEIVNG